MANLASDTEVQRAGGNGFTAELQSDWHLLVPNGGYLAAVTLRAAQQLCGLARPVSVSCQFLAPARFGRVEIKGEILRETARASALRLSMTQGEEHLLEALVWAAPEDNGKAAQWREMPEVAHADRFRDLRDQLVQAHAWVPRWHNCVNLRVASPQGSPPELTWAKFRPVPTFADTWLDACRSLILADSLQWPAIREGLPKPERTLALTVHLAVDFHATACDSAWLLAETRGSAVAQEFASGVSTIWSEDGRMLASGLQQMLLHELSRPAAFSRER